MAITAVAVGKIKFARRNGHSIPEGWVLNNDAKIETNSDVAYRTGKLIIVLLYNFIRFHFGPTFTKMKCFPQNSEP